MLHCTHYFFYKTNFSSFKTLKWYKTYFSWTVIKINKTFYKLIFSVLNGAPLNVVKQNVLIIWSMQDKKKTYVDFVNKKGDIVLYSIWITGKFFLVKIQTNFHTWKNSKMPRNIETSSEKDPWEFPIFIQSFHMASTQCVKEIIIFLPNWPKDRLD